MLNHDVRRTQLKIQRRLQLIQDRIYRQSVLLPPFRLLPLDNPLIPPPLDADTSTWEVIEHNTYWGAKYQNFALASTFTIPAAFNSASPVALFLDLGDSGDFDHPEALIYIDGQPYIGVDRRHHEIRLPDHLRDGREHRLLLHGWCGLFGGTDVPVGKKLHMKFSSVVQVDLPTRAFITAARSAWTAAVWLESNHPSKAWLFNALEEAFKVLDTREPLGEAFYASVPAAHETLRVEVEKAGQPLDVHIAATGHAHIDTAWLWTVDQTRRKAERTFSSVLRLMEEFPEFNFVQSQPQLYEWIRQDQPALFEQIKQRIAERRWEPIGGMWIEADCNLSGAESLARQFVLGRAFFRKHFGAAAESPILWLPDVFGYAWNLPQLIKQAGLEYFFTIKIGWNQYNRLPYDSFWWQGLDGTRILTHFSTAPEAGNINSRATYNADVDPMVSLGTWMNYQGKHLHNEMLMSYGWGDGGGGPTREMLENMRELDHTPGIPQVRPSFVVDFFRRLEAQAGDKLPTWNGELYLEAHRGTYTTQARNKRWNRKSEFMLHDAEFLATVASMMDDTYIYPHDIFHQAWELVCLHQFHDILPGSSINEVYADSAKYYAQVAELARTAKESALEVIKRTMGGDLLLINPSGAFNTDLLSWNGALPAGSMLEGDNHTLIYAQHSETETALRYSGGLPRLTIEPVSISRDETGEMDDEEAFEWIESSPTCLDNGRIRVELNGAGDITRIFHHALDREVLPAGTVANQFQTFEDRPNDWDAWDVDIFFEDRMTLAQSAESVRVIEQGGLRRTLEIRRRIQHSDYVQRISLAADSAAIDFDTTIEWREKHTLLKVAFPIDVLTTKATHEVQWGNVERPTTHNSSWDWARFETCAHKWVMLEENGFGAALINDCKYGHDVKDNVIRLSLLRSPTMPDAHADEGTHTFKYRLLVDADLFDTVQSAYAFNDPAFVVQGSGSPRMLHPLTFIDQMYTEFDQAQVQVETIKRAEDNNGVIVRLYEYGRTRGNVTIEFGFPIREAYRTNLLEENQASLPILDSASLRLFVKPFEIITLRLIPDMEPAP